MTPEKPSARTAAVVPTPSRVDPRSPFVFDLRELGRRPGSLREYSRSVPSPVQIGLDVIGVAPGAAIELDLRLESVTEGVLVTGRLGAPVTGQCARCLDPLTDTVDVDVCELFAYTDSATEETTGEDEVYRVDSVNGSRLDVEPVVRDAITLALPWTPLCRPDCPGLCVECGEHLAQLPAGHTHDAVDPRWAALTGMLDETSRNV